MTISPTPTQQIADKAKDYVEAKKYTYAVTREQSTFVYIDGATECSPLIIAARDEQWRQELTELIPLITDSDDRAMLRSLIERMETVK